MGVTHTVASGTSGAVTATAPAGFPNSTTWNLTSLQISVATPLGTGKVTIYDGSVATGTILYQAYINAPNLGSGGYTVDVPLPKDPYGRPTVQGSPGNAMNVQFQPAGAVASIVNCRFADGLP